MRILWMMLPVAATVTACDGPHEEAGEQADVAAGYSDTTGALRAGPNERRGEELDRLAETSAARHRSSNSK